MKKEKKCLFSFVLPYTFMLWKREKYYPHLKILCRLCLLILSSPRVIAEATKAWTKVQVLGKRPSPLLQSWSRCSRIPWYLLVLVTSSEADVFVMLFFHCSTLTPKLGFILGSGFWRINVRITPFLLFASLSLTKHMPFNLLSLGHAVSQHILGILNK